MDCLSSIVGHCSWSLKDACKGECYVPGHTKTRAYKVKASKVESCGGSEYFQLFEGNKDIHS